MSSEVVEEKYDEIEVEGPSRDEILSEDTRDTYIRHLEEEVKFLRSLLVQRSHGSIPRVFEQAVNKPEDSEDKIGIKGHVPFGSARARIEAILAKPRKTTAAPDEAAVKEEMEKEEA